MATSKSPVPIGNIKKSQFSLATSKSLVPTCNIKKAQFSLATSIPSSHWQHKKSPVLIGNIKQPSSHQQHQKVQFSLTILKAQFTLTLFYQKYKINTWQKCYVRIISLKKSNDEQCFNITIIYGNYLIRAHGKLFILKLWYLSYTIL